jgi:hypothetical protein
MLIAALLEIIAHESNTNAPQLVNGYKIEVYTYKRILCNNKGLNYYSA